MVHLIFECAVVIVSLGPARPYFSTPVANIGLGRHCLSLYS